MSLQYCYSNTLNPDPYDFPSESGSRIMVVIQIQFSSVMSDLDPDPLQSLS